MNENTKLLKKISEQLQTLIDLQTANQSIIQTNSKNQALSVLSMQELGNLYHDYGDLVMHENAQVQVTNKGVFVNDAKNNIHQVNVKSIMPESSYIQRVSLIKSPQYPKGAIEVKFKKGGAIWHYTPSKTCLDWKGFNVSGFMNSTDKSRAFHKFVLEEVKKGHLNSQRQEHLEMVA